MWNAAFRTTGRCTPPRILGAAILAAAVPAGAALLIVWLFPRGCDIRGAPAAFEWTCLLPGLLLQVAPAVAALLSVFALLNRRLKRPLADGWLFTVLAAGVLTQLVLIGYSLVALDAVYRDLFLDELLFVPQPFVAGAMAAAVFWVALHWRASPGR